ncbi:hypothetical protein WQQ_34550 [Hydrocarboniphaga effusa AP103]|uniref:Uncharacterized protein n=1 Tax=Hydrocarboniphaga effusa AP103 TaxID=1172194 RepID=I8T2U8_9GAMM|nr:hypothetical protein WQQ_34550 [Hydrocarboniphaga effusa AP103]
MLTPRYACVSFCSGSPVSVAEAGAVSVLVSQGRTVRDRRSSGRASLGTAYMYLKINYLGLPCFAAPRQAGVRGSPAPRPLCRM